MPKKSLTELYALFAAVKNEQEAKLLLNDILTPAELESLAERWQITKQIASGKPQRDIAKDIGVSISKITRGSRVWQHGSGGFKLLLERLQRKK